MSLEEPVYALGIDSSTQSCSGIIIDLNDPSVLVEESVNFGKALPQYNAPQGFIRNASSSGEHVQSEVHSNPLMWLDAVELLLEKLKKKCDLSKIKFVSGAGQQHGSVYLNSKWFDTVSNLDANLSLKSQIQPCLSRDTSPIWMDASTGAECKEIADQIGSAEKVCELSGSIPTERFTGPQIRKFYKKCTKEYENTSRIHLVSSFIGSVIAGIDSPIDVGDGAGMNLMNIKSFDWDKNLLDATAPGLDTKLPPICNGSSNLKIGNSVSKYFIEKYGFSSDCNVILFTGDNPSSLVGMGASSTGKVVISLGTSDTFFAAMKDPRTDPNGSGHVFGNPIEFAKSNTDGDGSNSNTNTVSKYMTLQCFLNGSLAREKVRDRFQMSWGEFATALSSTKAGNNNNIMLPFFGNEISPKLIGDNIAPILSGTEDFKGWKTPNEIIRSCVECQVVNMKCCVKWMNLSPTHIFLTGGASENDSIAQIVADVFQARVSRLQSSSSCGLGAAIRAASYAKTSQYDFRMDHLQKLYCKFDPKKDVLPSLNDDTKNVYNKLSKSYLELLSASKNINL
eukprot:g6083.t1